MFSKQRKGSYGVMLVVGIFLEVGDVEAEDVA